MEMQAADRGFKELLLQSVEGRERMLLFRAHIRPLVAELVRRARDAGELRADVVEDDVLLVSLMTGAVADFANDVEPELWRRSLALLLDGLRATGRVPAAGRAARRRAGRPRNGRLAAGETLNMSRCTHLDQVEILELPGDHRRLRGMPRRAAPQWVHLRMCQTCGHIGCCDNSPGRHATAHNGETGHPIIRSAEPDEDWSFCYEDDLMFILRSS